MSGPPGVHLGGGGRRRQRTARRRARRRRWPVTLLVIALLVGGGAALALTGATHGSRAGSSPASGPPRPLDLASGAEALPPGHHATSAEPRALTAGRRAALAQRRIDEPIDRVLAYTPFLVRGAGRHRAIALTFDDGPSPYTPAIVHILVQMRAPATFFVVGQQLRYFSAGLRDELRHGFEVGDHTRNHAWLTHLPPAAQQSQVSIGAGELQRLGAPRPVLFRPPYGAYDAVTLRILRRMHMLMVMWSIDPGDWRRPGSVAITRSVLAAARPGAVVIMHDGGGDRSQTVAALPRIIRGLRRKHFDLVSVARLLALDPPSHHQRLPRVGAA